jgi:hypothetical protein
MFQKTKQSKQKVLKVFVLFFRASIVKGFGEEKNNVLTFLSCIRKVQPILMSFKSQY